MDNLILLLSLGVTGYGLFAYLVLEPGSTVHPAMKSAYEAHPARILTHVVFAAVALLTGPFQFFPAIRQRRRLHRALGYVYFSAVIGGGLAGFCTAFIAFGGLVSTFGFGLLSLAWLWTALAALKAARQRDFVGHERWAIRSFALTFAAVTLRIYLGSFFALGLPFEEFYPLLSWLCWVPNLLLVEWGLLARQSPPAVRT